MATSPRGLAFFLLWPSRNLGAKGSYEPRRRFGALIVPSHGTGNEEAWMSTQGLRMKDAGEDLLYVSVSYAAIKRRPLRVALEV